MVLLSVYVGIGICILISVIDVRNYIIPDMLLCVLALIFFIPDIIFVPKQIPLQLVQGLAIFLLFALIYRFVGGLGFGDVKMIGILGYRFGFLPSVLICLFASVSALLLYSIKYIVSTDLRKKHLLLQKIPLVPLYFMASNTASRLSRIKTICCCKKFRLRPF